jgi:hypothetical protein
MDILSLLKRNYHCASEYTNFSYKDIENLDKEEISFLETLYNFFCDNKKAFGVLKIKGLGDYNFDFHMKIREDSKFINDPKLILVCNKISFLGMDFTMALDKTSLLIDYYGKRQATKTPLIDPFLLILTQIYKLRFKTFLSYLKKQNVHLISAKDNAISIDHPDGLLNIVLDADKIKSIIFKSKNNNISIEFKEYI